VVVAVDEESTLLVSDQRRLSGRRPRSEGQLGLLRVRRIFVDVSQDPRNDLRLLDAGDHLALPAAANARVDLDDKAQQPLRRGH
jgi:hypothetical protein